MLPFQKLSGETVVALSVMTALKCIHKEQSAVAVMLGLIALIDLVQ